MCGMPFLCPCTRDIQSARLRKYGSPYVTTHTCDSLEPYPTVFTLPISITRSLLGPRVSYPTQVQWKGLAAARVIHKLEREYQGEAHVHS